MKKEKKAKLPKGVSSEFADSLNTMSVEELKARIVTMSLQNAENEAFKESLQYIQAKSEYDYAKETFELVAGPVRDTTVALKNQTKMVIDRLKEKGGA